MLTLFLFMLYIISTYWLKLLRKGEMKSFDEWKVRKHAVNSAYGDSYFLGAKRAWDYKQAEIDVLQLDRDNLKEVLSVILLMVKQVRDLNNSCIETYNEDIEDVLCDIEFEVNKSV